MRMPSMLLCAMFTGINALLPGVAALAQATPAATKLDFPAPGKWIGIHLPAPSPDALPLLKRGITEALAPMGVNAIIFEINYNFQYQSHPELASPRAWSKEQIRELADHCRQSGIRLIPQFNCLGHQSWARNTFSLLTQYPEIDETPNIPKDNPGIYCRSWCPLHPKINEIVFPMLDELIDAFQCDAFHVGMDEVFLIASEQCERCKGKDPAELFAKSVNDLYDHLVKERKQTMLMWADRFLDATSTGYGRWEASANGTAPAIDRVPKDIVMCDWHYERRDSYPSIPLFIEKGFRVWPCPWNKVEACQALISYGKDQAGERMLGTMFTLWGSTDRFLKSLMGDDVRADPAATPDPVAVTMRAHIELAGGKALPAAAK
jgi:Glycosyl hydrolase family 20, catalytic domain